MDLSAKVLGQHVANQLQTRITAPILTIGNDKFTRGDLARIECFNFAAAVNIDRVCQEFQVKNTRDLFQRIAPTAFAVPRVGPISLAVLGACFQAKNVGGEHPLEAWIAKHAEHGANDLRTFHTIKKQALKEQREEKKALRRRRRAEPTHVSSTEQLVDTLTH